MDPPVKPEDDGIFMDFLVKSGDDGKIKPEDNEKVKVGGW